MSILGIKIYMGVSEVCIHRFAHVRRNDKHETKVNWKFVNSIIVAGIVHAMHGPLGEPHDVALFTLLAIPIYYMLGINE